MVTLTRLRDRGFQIPAIAILSFAGFAAVLALVILLLWSRDVHRDRLHTLTAQTMTPVFAGNGDDDCDTQHPIGFLKPGDRRKVLRIRYLKDCAMVDFDDPYGKRMHIVLGVGKVSLSPQLSGQ